MNRACLLLGALALAVGAALPGGGCGKKPEGAQGATAGSAAQSPAAVFREVHAALGNDLLKAVADHKDASTQLAQHSADIDRLVEATRAESVDWGVDWSRGSNTDVSHLPQVRALARVLKADAERLLAQGDADGAAKRIAAALRLAEHTTRDAHSVIELLAGAAVASTGAEFVAEHPQLAKAPWKTDIQQAIVLVQRGGTLNSAEVIRRDGATMARGLRDGNGPDMSAAGGHNWARESKAAREDAAQKIESLTARAVTAWKAGDTATLAGLADRSTLGAAIELVPALDKSYEMIAKVRGSLTKASATLR